MRVRDDSIDKDFFYFRLGSATQNNTTIVTKRLVGEGGSRTKKEGTEQIKEKGGDRMAREIPKEEEEKEKEEEEEEEEKEEEEEEEEEKEKEEEEEKKEIARDRERKP
ncbi:hypothetical protein Pmani_017499 [Petrolisthes manimaculis]|uniref:Uncharacterized protein n=1 Tax=Petrolisthes manimaculis TaxID=1843537 RepID=A0AAE1U9T5_9EUCA|nr:hypothetical protein Pmani_017499 [Petrolisthes manimaculis]